MLYHVDTDCGDRRLLFRYGVNDARVMLIPNRLLPKKPRCLAVYATSIRQYSDLSAVNRLAHISSCVISSRLKEKLGT